MFKIGDKVKFKKSSINTGMSDATESDVFEVSKVGPAHIQLRDVIYSLTGWWNVTHFEHVKEEIMSHADSDTEKYIPKVGDKLKGFKFDSGTDGVGYDTEMDDYVEEVGVVVDVYTDSFVVQFPDSLEWMYPASLSHLSKIEESSQEISHEDGQIDWEVGQVVWDVRNGRGIVKSTEYEGGYPIFVEFDLKDFDGENVTDCYTLDGRYAKMQTLRSLFFSEPVITAELFPPKKPFVPTLKEGDEVLIEGPRGGQIFRREVKEETEDKVICKYAGEFEKIGYKFTKLGEEIKFS